MARLGDVCEILNGFSFKSDQYTESGIRIIRIANVQNGYIEDLAPVFYPLDDKNALKYELAENDLLISLTGNVGRVGILTKRFLPAALNQRVACIRIKNQFELEKTFLFHFLNSENFQQACIHSSKGVAQKNMSTEWLKDYIIPLPSLDEQRKIAAVLDKVSDLIAKRRQQLDKLDLLVKSKFVEMFGDPITNPLHWSVRKIQECLVEIDSGKSLNCESFARPGCEPAVLKLSAVTYGEYNPKENKLLPSADMFIEAAEVHSGDLLFSRKNTREYVGMTAYVKETPPSLMMPDLIFRLVTRPECRPRYLGALLNHPTFRPAVTALANGTTGSMPNISKQKLSNLSVILPPVERQNKFEELLKQADKSKSTIQQSLEKLETLKKSLMQEYYE